MAKCYHAHSTANVRLLYYEAMLLSRLLILLAIFAAITVCNICVGDVTLSPVDAWQALCHTHSSTQIIDVLWQIRLPRLLIAMFVGANLAISGYILQNISRNPLADPFLSGVSSGSALFVALGLILGVDFMLIPGLAFAGGLIASLIAATLAKDALGLSTTRLLLAGVGLSAISGGIVTLLLTTNPSLTQSQGILFWLAGSVAGRSWQELSMIICCNIIGTTLALLLSKQMRLLALGASSAQALGLDVKRIQWSLLAVAVLLCGSAVSVSGLVGFVGLIAPHIARKLFGSDERVQIIASALLGASLVLLSDLAARTLASGQELPLGTLLSIAGGPFFLWLIYKHKDGNF